MKRSRSPLFWSLAALLVGFVLILPWDATIAQWCRDQRLPGELRTLLRLSEVFAHGYGVAAILITLCLVIPQMRRGLIWTAIAAYGSGLVANIIKINIARMRPQSLETLEFKAWLIGFDGWLPWLNGAEGWLDRDIQAFPSGHMTTAVALAVGLGTLFPKARWWFAVLALLAGMQRIDAGAHFPSDVVAGAIVGLSWGSLTMRLSQTKKRSTVAVAPQPKTARRMSA